MDYPLILNFGDTTIESNVSISWEKFDDLAIESDRVLPSNSFFVLRWICEGIDALESAIGKILSEVSLGPECPSPFGKPIEAWTHLLLTFEDGSALDIFNAVDETGFSFEPEGTTGSSIHCVPSKI